MSTSIFSLQYSSTSSSSHHLLTRRVSDVVLLIHSVPPWCNESHLKSLLAESCGGLKQLRFLSSKAETKAWCSPTPPPIPTEESEVIDSPYFKKVTEVKFHDALVVFKSAACAQKLLARKKEEPLVLQSETRKPVVGLRRWISDYSSRIITDWNHFQKDLDDYMVAYDERKATESAELKEMSEVADDDGWVTVTSKSKKGARKPNNNNNNNNNHPRSKAKAKAAGKKKELLNFYKFQKKEKKEDLIQNLREKFEEDKKRVAQMRSERKFKPY